MFGLLVAVLAHTLLGRLLLTTAIGGHLPNVCNDYKPLYASINRDLAIYKRNGGISPDLVNRTILLHSAGHGQKGLALGIYNGKVYIVSDTPTIGLDGFHHHVSLWVAYIKTFLDLEEKYGPSLPNVEFVWHTADWPAQLANTTRNGENFPVFRFCKSIITPDILVPIFHFNMKRYQTEFLDRIPEVNAEMPWEERRPVVFARFTLYTRHVHPADPTTQRLGEGGAPLCEVTGSSTAICPVRSYLRDWAAKYTDDLDIDHNHIPMRDHAKYRYILHVDGQGLSSKLEMLLSLGSLVMKEDSGYMAFYHHLLKPFKHFVPVWGPGTGPETILDALTWARAHDSEARRIAAAGQALVARYLSSEARTCFWLKLLEEYGSTLSYDPIQYRGIELNADGWVARGAWRYIKPARKFLQDEVRKYHPRDLEMDWEP